MNFITQPYYGGEYMSDAIDLHKYTGMQKFTDIQGGFFFWIPAGWKHMKIDDKGNSHFFTPNENRMDTGFLSEKRQLDFKVTKDDVPILKEGFINGINMLPKVQIEQVDETITDQMIGIEAKFSFKEEGQTRVRWMRLIYSGKSLLILSAIGTTLEEYERYKPMFFNIMMSTTFI